MSSEGTLNPGLQPYLYYTGTTEEDAKVKFQLNLQANTLSKGLTVFAAPSVDVTSIRTRSQAEAQGIAPLPPPPQRSFYDSVFAEWQWGWFDPVWVLEDGSPSVSALEALSHQELEQVVSALLEERGYIVHISTHPNSPHWDLVAYGPANAVVGVYIDDDKNELRRGGRVSLLYTIEWLSGGFNNVLQVSNRILDDTDSDDEAIRYAEDFGYEFEHWDRTTVTRLLIEHPKAASKVHPMLLPFVPANQSRRSDYAIDPAPLGVGGQARVSRAIHNGRGDKVAFKEALTLNDEDSRARIRREIESKSHFHHYNIMPILDYSMDECWLAMPIADYTLDKYAEGPPISNSDILEIVSAVLEALDVAHAAQWVHRDVKPSNILYLSTAEGRRWVLADWGLVRRPPGQTSLPGRTAIGLSMGTEGYAAPELSIDPHSAGPTADFYSLGQVIGWAVTQQEPRKNIPNIPKGPWRTITKRLTQLSPTDRPQTVGEIRHLVEITKNALMDNSASLSDTQLLSEARKNSQYHLDALLDRAHRDPGNSSYFFDILPALDIAQIRDAAITDSVRLRQLTDTMTGHRDSDWGRRGFDSMNLPIQFGLNVARVGAEIGDPDLFEAGVECALKLEARWNRFDAHGRIVGWMKSIGGHDAQFVATVFATNPDVRARFSELRDDPGIPLLIRSQIEP